MGCVIMKLGKKIVIAGLCLILLLAAVYFGITAKFNSDMASLRYQEINMTDVGDGTYIGTAETLLIKVDAEVTVADHKIKAIRLLRHENGQGKPAEIITDQMILDNTYKTDLITGATYSSKVIQSAVSDALTKGMVK